MKKFKLFSFILVLSILGSLPAFGEDEVYKTALFGSDYNSQSVSSYTASWTATNNGFTVSLANFNNNNNGWSYVKCGRKNNASVATIITSAAIDKAVTKVDVTIDAITASNINSIKLYTSSNNSTWTEAGSYTKAKGTQSVSLSTPTANLYYKVEFDCASGSSNGLLTLSKVEYYKEKSVDPGTCAAPTFTPDGGNFVGSTTVTLSSTTSGATIYYTMGNNPSDPTTSSTQYTSAGISVTETTTIKAIAVKSGMTNSNVVSKTFTKATILTVAQARAAIDAGGDLTDKYVHGIVSEIVEPLNTTYHNISYNFSDDGQTTSNQLEAFRGKSYNGDNFYSNDDIQVGDEVIVHGTLKKYSSTYELDAGNQLVKRSAHLSWNGTSANSFQAELGGTNTFPTLANADNVSVSFSSSNGDAATIDASTGTITLVAVGNTTITATFAGNNDFFTKSVSYTLVVESSVVKADISFECNEATSGCPTSGLTDQTNLPDELPVLAKDGKNFGGWFMDSEFNTPAVAGAAVTSTYPITLYAKWLDPYTVTQALAIIDALADGAQTESSVYVAGIVSTAPTAAPSSGKLTFYISANGQATNELQAFNCKNLNNESFTAQTDIQVGDEVTVFGPLKKYMKSGNPIPEFNTGYLYAFNRPAVAVTGIDLTESTAEVEVGSTVTLHASVEPSNATNKTINWSVQSGSDYASVADGVVTGIAAGTAVIRATSDADNTKYAECTVTITAADPTKHVVTFDATVDKTTENTDLSITKSNVTIAITDGDGRFNNGTDYREYKNSVFTVSCSAGNITKIEFTCNSGNPITGFADATGLDKDNAVWTGNAESVSFTASNKQVQITQLVITYKEDSRAESGLAWDPADDIEITVGETFTAPTLLNPNNIAAADITIASSNTNLATVTAGVVSLVANATGEATITATFAGNTTYKPATVLYKITVSEPNVTFDSSVDHAESGETTLTKSGFTLSFTSGVLDGTQAEYRLYKGQTMTLSSTDYLIQKIEFTCTSGNPITGFADATGLDKENNQWTGESNTVELTASNNQVRMTKIKVFYVEDPRAASGLAWSTDEVELTLGETFIAANLVNPNSIAASEITITSNNTDLATVTNGVVELVDDAIGTATITATFAGNATYKPASVSYSIIVLDPTPAIITNPDNKLDWGTVNKGTSPADKTIAITLHFLSSVDADLSDPDGVFDIDNYNYVDGDVITVSVINTTTLGTHSATLTLSDPDGLADDKKITLSVEIENAETPVSTTSKWVVASAVADGDEVLLTGVKSDVTYALSTQANNNRTAVEGSLSEGVFTPGANTMSVTLVEQSTGKYALRTSNGKYLYAASSSSNHMKTRDAIGEDGAAVWTITIDDNNEASIVANCETTNWRNVMQFNSGSTLFSCYASASQQPIKLYVRKYAVIIPSSIENGTVTASPSLTDAGETVTLTTTPDPGYILKSLIVRTEAGGSVVTVLNNTFSMPADNVVVEASFVLDPTPPTYTVIRSGLTAGRYYSLCYPKKMTEIKGGTLWSFAGKDASMAYLVQAEAPYAAGMPYFIYAESDKFEAVVEGDDATQAGNINGLYGTLEYLSNADLTGKGATHLLKNNELHPLGEAYLSAYKAYVIVGSISGGKPAATSGKQVRSMPLHVDTTTGLNELNTSEAPTKVIINGQLYILRGEKMFDATGRLVK